MRTINKIMDFLFWAGVVTISTYGIVQVIRLLR